MVSYLLSVGLLRLNWCKMFQLNYIFEYKKLSCIDVWRSVAFFLFVWDLGNMFFSSNYLYTRSQLEFLRFGKKTPVCNELLLTKFSNFLGLPPYPVWLENQPVN